MCCVCCSFANKWLACKFSLWVFEDFHIFHELYILEPKLSFSRYQSEKILPIAIITTANEMRLNYDKICFWSIKNINFDFIFIFMHTDIKQKRNDILFKLGWKCKICTIIIVWFRNIILQFNCKNASRKKTLKYKFQLEKQFKTYIFTFYIFFPTVEAFWGAH